MHCSLTSLKSVNIKSKHNLKQQSALTTSFQHLWLTSACSTLLILFFSSSHTNPHRVTESLHQSLHMVFSNWDNIVMTSETLKCRSSEGLFLFFPYLSFHVAVMFSFMIDPQKINLDQYLLRGLFTCHFFPPCKAMGTLKESPACSTL